MARECCHNCAYAWWDLGQAMQGFASGFPNRPACANHPDSLGRMRPVTIGGVCRNYRPKPADPAKGAKQIPLGDGLYAYVDAADYEWLSQYNWRLQNGYAARREKNKVIYMHREIMNPPDGMMVDHVRRNKLDNTRDSLRVCTQQQNAHNNAKHMGSSSRFKGVGYSTEKQKWFAKIYINGKRIWLGYFDDEVAAARAYDRAAVEHFGEFAHLNFPEEWPPQRRAEVHAQRNAAKPRTEDRRRRTAGTKEGKRKKEKGKNIEPRAETPGRRDRKRAAKSARTTGHKPRAMAPKGPKRPAQSARRGTTNKNSQPRNTRNTRTKRPPE